MEQIIEKKSYTDGMFFELRITSRYLGIMGNKVLEKLKSDLNFEEYVILDTISYNDGICHSDLAKLLLRDKSNIGKIASNLENNGYVKIRPGMRNSRVIKKIFITEVGIKICNNIYDRLKTYIHAFNKNFTEEEQKLITSYMKKCRAVLEETANIQT